jgi:hypothetical protein
MSTIDPFTGVWHFAPELSSLSTPVPQSWLHDITVQDNEISVREQTVRTDGTNLLQSLWAKFDGSPYPVKGSPLVDSIAYTRIDKHTIEGTGYKQSREVLAETVSVSKDHTSLTIDYKIKIGDRLAAYGIAVFLLK